MKSLKFNVYGRQVLVTSSTTGWRVYYLSAEGKRRMATDIMIPFYIQETDIEQYLDDLCHEWATEQYPSVTRLD